MVKYKSEGGGGEGMKHPQLPRFRGLLTDLLGKLKKVPVIGSWKQMTGNREISKWRKMDGKRMQTSFQGSIGRHRFTFLKKTESNKA